MNYQHSPINHIPAGAFPSSEELHRTVLSDSAPWPRLLAVTNRQLCSRPFEEQIRRVCACHPQALILREKDLSESEYQKLAKQVLEICRTFQVPCILHSFPDAARHLGCDAIHLPLSLLRAHQNELSDFTVIGTSVHSLEEAQEGERLGATYLTAGHIYTTDCKKGVPPRGTDFLREVCLSTTLPVYAIGGIQLETAQMEEILSCGARGGCIMSQAMKV